MIDDFRLWGSSRCRRIGEYSTETGLLTWMVHTIDNHNASLRGRSPRRCGWRLSRNAPSEAGQHRLPASDATKRSEAAPRAFPLARRGGAPCEGGTRSAAQRSVPGSQPTQCNTLGLARGFGPFEPPTGGNSPCFPHHPRRSLLPLPGTWSLALTLACTGRSPVAGLGAGTRSLGPGNAPSRPSGHRRSNRSERA